MNDFAMITNFEDISAKFALFRNINTPIIKPQRMMSKIDESLCEQRMQIAKSAIGRHPWKA